MNKHVGKTLVLGLVATLAPVLNLVPGAAPEADAAVCYKRDVISTSTKGRHVWIPSSLKTGFTSGKGPVTVTWNQEENTAKTRGSADTVSGGGGLSLGPIADVSASYDREWNRSTTDSKSKGITYSRTWEIPAKGKWRIRWYQGGREFLYTKTMFYTNCPKTESKWRVRVPLAKKPLENRLVATESYKNRNKVRY